MASNLGTVFVELSLDDKVYKQKLSDTLTSTQTTAKGAETAWKALGVKSDAVFEAQARAAQNAYTLIKNSATSTANDIIRAEEAKNQKIQSLNEQQFGKQTSFIDSLKANWIATSVAVVAAWGLVNKAVGMMDQGAHAQQVASSFKIMADAAGVSSDDMIASMKAATKETIDDSDLMQKANKLMLAGYNPDQIVRFSGVVIAASQYMGTSVSESYERISDALATRMPKAMVQAGAVTKDQMAIVTKALEGGATQSELMELAIANLAVKTLKLQGTQDGATLSLQRFHAQVAETKELVGMGLIAGLQKLGGVFQEIGVLSLYSSAGMWKAIGAYASFQSVISTGGLSKAWADISATYRSNAEADLTAAGVLAKKAHDNFMGISENGAKASKAEIDAAQAVVDAQMKKLGIYHDNSEAAKKAAHEQEQAYKSITEAIRKATYEAETIGQTQYEKDVARINSEAEKYAAAGVGKVTVAKFVAVEMQVADEKAYEVMAKNARAASDTAISEMERQVAAGVKLSEDHVRGAEEYRKIVAGEYDFAATENERQINKIIADETEKFHKISMLYDQGYISFAEAESAKEQIHKNTTAAILEKETENALKIAKLNSDLIKDVRGWEKEAYEARIKEIDAEAAKAIKDGADYAKVMAKKQDDTEKAYTAMVAASSDFFTGLSLGLKKAAEEEKTVGEQGIALGKEIYAAKKGFIEEGVTAFIKGEDAKLAIQEYAGNLAVSLASKYSTMAFDAAIEGVIEIIGALIGQGAAQTGAIAAKGGYAAAIAGVLGYLAGGVAAMLGGKALANQFKAEGGWIGSHPDGGIIRQGSGFRDDVYLGRTESTRHWGMGGEFVVNKESSAENEALLTLINKSRRNVVNDYGLAAGGYTGSKGQELVGDPNDLALDMALGGEMSFGTAFGEAMGGGSDIYGAIAAGIAADILYIETAMGGAIGGKVLANAFKAEGGTIRDMGHWGLSDIGKLFIPPGFPTGGGDISLGPLGTWNPKDASRGMGEWFDKMWRAFLDSQRAGWRNYAEAILTPGTGVDFDPMNGLLNELNHFWDFVKTSIKIVTRPPGYKAPFGLDALGGRMDSPLLPFSARSGLDYVPRDRFPIIAHEGEAVLKKKDAQDWRGGSTRGGVTVNFNFPKALIVDKAAVNDLALMIYPQMKKLEAWGH